MMVSGGVFKCSERARNMEYIMCAMFKVWPAGLFFVKSLVARCFFGLVYIYLYVKHRTLMYTFLKTSYNISQIIL